MDDDLIIETKTVTATATEITNSIGLYFRIDDPFRALIEQYRNMKAAHHADVVIEVDGVKHEMTLGEFVSRVTGV